MRVQDHSAEGISDLVTTAFVGGGHRRLNVVLKLLPGQLEGQENWPFLAGRHSPEPLSKSAMFLLPWVANLSKDSILATVPAL